MFEYHAQLVKNGLFGMAAGLSYNPKSISI